MSTPQPRSGRHGKRSRKGRVLGMVTIVALSAAAVFCALQLTGFGQAPVLPLLKEVAYPSSETAGSAASTAASSAAATTAEPQETTAVTKRPTTTPTKKPVSMTGDEYFDQILFIGDSRTAALRNRKQIASSNAFAFNGMSHSVARHKKCVDLGTGSLLTIPQAVGVRKPPIMLVAFGINGVAFMGKTNFMEEYEEFIDMLREQSPDSVLIIQSILPVSKAYAEKDPRMANGTIDWYNEKLRELAAQKGAHYLDVSEALKGADNNLDPRYDSGDGLHFNTKAGEVIVDYVRSHPVDLG